MPAYRFMNVRIVKRRCDEKTEIAAYSVRMVRSNARHRKDKHETRDNSFRQSSTYPSSPLLRISAYHTWLQRFPVTGSTVMRLSVEMDKVYGDFRIEQYSIVFRRSNGKVRFELLNNESHHMQKGGRLMVP